MSERQLETLDLNLVLTLHWVLTEQNVSRAAERLGVSQPAVSHGLKRLRDAFGDPLLVKSGRTMRPTPRAERMKPEVARIVAGLRELFQVEAAFDPAVAQGRFRIAASDNWAVLAARAWARSVAPLAPKLALDVVAIEFPVAQDLISGAVDLVIMPEAKLLDLPPGLDIDQFVQRPLCEEAYLTGVPDGVAAASGGGLSLEAFLAESHVLVSPAGASFGVVDDLLTAQGRTRRVAYRTESFLAGVHVAREAGCLITAPRSSFLAERGGLRVVDPPLPVPGYAVLTGWHPNWTGDARHRWLREKLSEGLTEVVAADPRTS